ncbi:hypothetical protein BJ742DRAFT_801351 [Cladochytrium replicatum]|nr:hypothetical protein BJ742DRAFT_801351 [Cladochytrium replicatum]
MVHYSLYYYQEQARAEVVRLILAYSGAEWSNRFANDWPAEKPLTPFNQIPVLTETDDDGSVLTLAQTRAIERYLARKYGLLGSTPKESALIESIQESYVDLYAQFRAYRRAPADQKEQVLRTFKDTQLAKFIENHKKFIKIHGKAGHFYIGDKVSLADLHALQAIQGINAYLPGLLTEEMFPELFAVYRKVLEVSERVREYVESPDRVPAWH